MKNLNQFLLLALTSFLIVSNRTFAQQAGSLDVSFDNDGKVFNGIQTTDIFKNKMKLGKNGKIVIAGSQSVNKIVVSRFNQNGAFDISFGVNGTFTSIAISGLYHVYDLVILPDNSIIVLAWSANPAFGSFIFKITSSGVIDTSFQSNGFLYFPNCTYVVMELQSNGKIVIGGKAFVINFAPDLQVIRLNADGNYDLSFGNDGINSDGISKTDFGFEEVPIDLRIDFEGKILLLGYASNTVLIAKYNTDGSLDNSFDNDGKLLISQIQLENNTGVSSMIIQNDNKIVICGSSYISRLNRNGTFDISFDNDGVATYAIGHLQDINIQKDGKLVVSLLALSPKSGTGMARLTTTGALDTSFDGDGIQNEIFTPSYSGSYNAYSVAIQDDGKIIFGGVLNQNLYVVRLHGVSNFNSNYGKMIAQVGTSDDVANGIAVRPNGKIITGGYSFNAVNNSSNNDFALVAYNADGSLDYTFGNNAVVKTEINAFSSDEIRAIALQADGKIVVGGTTTANASTNTNIVIARYLADGSNLDASFGVGGKTIIDFQGTQDQVYAMAIQTDGKILVAGSTVNGANIDFSMARININGTLDATFGTNGKVQVSLANYSIGRALAMQTDGKIVAAVFVEGDFGVLRFNNNGSLDNSFDGDGKVIIDYGLNSFDEVYGIAIQPDGKILISGNTDKDGTDDFAIMRFNTNGSLDNTFGSGGKTHVDINSGDLYPSIALFPSGKIILAGQSGYANYGIAYFNPNGSLDTNFDTDGKLEIPIGYGMDGPTSMAIVSQNQLLIAGYYFNGTNNDFALVKLLPIPCYSGIIILNSPTSNYPNVNLPSTQEARNIIALNSIASSPPNITYSAANSILLAPGFQVNSGAVFKTEINTCSY